ncbi:flagellar hook-basal body protein [Pseudomonas japonica]|uniref:Flagellar basal-body rod protein FlgG n=1 Tax=Pseudomonas japonica TaxID=256466 RepID=A0A239BL55_9PSED|nr:flagellar hook-basal body complex protein [Pseudomonas japonica]SNS08372.1 flagellar basal-body rod protein FlgG [Pseudomonas japonica]
MSDLIMQLAGVIQRDIDSLKAVSQNVANANTSGYRASRAFNVMATPEAAIGTSQGLDGIETQTSLDLRGGALQLTGKATDLALSGDAWFTVQGPRGTLLTRDGRFHVDNAGYLVNAGGQRVLGDGGALQIGNGTLKVERGGQVLVDDQPVASLHLLRVSDPTRLSAVGNGLYQHAGRALPAQDYQVHQGMQEGSNVALGTDMVKIMEVSRHVESMQRALSAYDGMLNSGINQLGKD